MVFVLGLTYRHSLPFLIAIVRLYERIQTEGNVPDT